MNKIFNIFLYIFLFVFATSINSLPRNALLEKRALESNQFFQCTGNFPIIYTSAKYTPGVFIPGQNVTETDVWDTNVTLDQGTLIQIDVFLNNKLVHSTKTDYCSQLTFMGLQCPLPPGHHEATYPFSVNITPDDPKGSYRASIKVLAAGETQVVSCIEGTIDVQ